MHNIYINDGSLNFKCQIPKIMYSTIITSIINIILKQLSLSELTIVSLQKGKNLKSAMNKLKKINKRLQTKFIIFFLLSNILNLFFWYYISCFCAVYINTQVLLIREALYSFLLSMIYQFGLSLLSGMLRILALRAKKRDKEYLYKISCVILLI